MPGPLGVHDHHELTEAQRDTLRYIERYDLRAEVEAAIEADQVPRSDAKSAERELKRFLAVVYLEGGKAGALAPSREVDALWHNFILNTRSYHRFCQAVYGEYLHHVPAGGEADVEKVQEGIELVRRLFGDVDERVWKEGFRICFVPPKLEGPTT